MGEKHLTLSLKSLWFWWLITTFAYILFGLAGFPFDGPAPVRYVAGVLGLFVPYGIASSLLFLSPTSWLSLAVFITAMIFAERRLNKKDFSLGKRIVLNLLILLILTTVVDLLRGTPFWSWIILFEGQPPIRF